MAWNRRKLSAIADKSVTVYFWKWFIICFIWAQNYWDISAEKFENEIFYHYCIFIKIKIKIDVFSINSFSQVQWDFLIILGSLNSYESEFSENICFCTFSAHFRRFFAENFSYKVKPVIHRLFSPKNSRYYILYDEYIYILKVYRQTVSMSPNMLKNLL